MPTTHSPEKARFIHNLDRHLYQNLTSSTGQYALVARWRTRAPRDMHPDEPVMTRPIDLERYEIQAPRWPEAGRHVLAQFDDATVVVYQAYRRSIGEWAVANQRFGGPDFSFKRMTWIKPNFLWMMYRSGWGTKTDQEVVLALRIRRDFFDLVLERAVPSSFDASRYDTREKWSDALSSSDVRLQWDPDHLPSGDPTERRAIQLGLRSGALRELTGPGLAEVIDMSDIVSRGRQHLANGQKELLMTPTEQIYPLSARLHALLGSP